MRALILLALLPMAAWGRDAVVEWDLATQREDGTPIAAGELVATRIEWGTCVGTAFGTSAGLRDVAAPAVTTTIVLGNGLWCFRGYSVDSDGQVSVASNVVSVHFKGRPKPPNIKSVK